jgi:hypothetical protein
MVPPEGSTVSVSVEPTRISPEKTPSITPGQYDAKEPREVEASTPPNSPPTSMRHHGQEVVIVIVSPKQHHEA